MKQSLKEELNKLRIEKELDEIIDRERKISKDLYAIKLVERIVFALVGAIALGVLYALLNIVLKQ